MRASVRVSRFVVPALLAALTILPARAPAAPTLPGPCPTLTNVAHIGRACVQPDGNWKMVLPDGYTFESHGPDGMVAGDVDEATFFWKLDQKPAACVTDTSKQFHFQLIYARPSDVSLSRYTQMVPKIRYMLGLINGMLDYEGREFGLKSLRYRMPCQGGQVNIARIDLPTTRKTTTVVDVIDAARQAGFTSSLAKYWLWADIPPQGGVAGQSDITQDDKPEPTNGNNLGPNYAVFFGLTGPFGASVMMHEASHGLGAVQSSAPNSNPIATQAGFGNHCTDDPDVMCYQAAAAQFYRDGVCSRTHFDCGHNDYFNPKPKKGSYLDTHWNLGSPALRYFSGCTYSTGVLTAGTGGADVDGTVKSVKSDWKTLASAKHSVSSSCWGHSFVSSAIVVPPSLPGNHPASWAVAVAGVQGPVRRVLVAPPTDVDVCFYKGSKALRCYAAASFEKGTIPSGTTSVKVTLVEGANATYVFSAF